MPADRHAAEIDAIRRDVVSAPSMTERADRARVLAGDSPREMSGFLDKVRHASYKITDEDIAALRRAGLGDDEIFELTVAAAVGIALDRFEAAKRAMRGTV